MVSVYSQSTNSRWLSWCWTYPLRKRMALSKFIRRILPLVMLCLLAFLAYQIKQTKPPAFKGEASSAPRLVVETDILEEAPFSVMVESFGVVQARTNSELFALISGQIQSVSPRYESGAFFKKGDVLLTVDAADYAVAMQVAKGSLVNAELALAEEEARYDQAQRDWKKQSKAIKATDFALRLPQLRAAKSNIETAKAQLSLAELNLARTKIRAPYDGRILTTFVNVGSVIGPNVTLAQIYSSDALEVRLPVANKALRFINLPEQSDVDKQKNPLVVIENKLTEPPQLWQGSVMRTEAKIDAASQQLYVVARIDDPFQYDKTHTRRPLKIGQFVRANISGQALENVISIPNSTVYQGSYVYVVKNERLQRQPVDVLWRDQTTSVIKSGLESGQHLVTTLLGQITSGTLVDVKDKDKNEGDDKSKIVAEQIPKQAVIP
jgi:RND family efflux transporter MFP subunit